MLEDIYAETAECVRVLRNLGREEDADNLNRGLYGASSGEALALIGAALQAALRGNRDLPADARARLKRLLRDVDRVFRSRR